MGKKSLYTAFCVLFIISVGYFYWFGNGIFFFQEQNILFIYSLEYLERFLDKPGGLLEYAANFLTQGCFSPFYGSILLSSLLILLGIILLKIYKCLQVSSDFSLLLILLPSCILLWLHAKYEIFVMHSLGYTLALLWFLLSRRPAIRNYQYAFPALFPVLYYLIGSFALAYLGIAIVYSFLHERGNSRYILPALLAGIAVLSYLVFKQVLFLQPAGKLLGYPLYFYDSSELSTILGLLTGLIILFPLIISTTAQFREDGAYARIIPPVSIAAIFIISIYMLSRAYDPEFSRLMTLEKSVGKQDWNAVIGQHEKNPSKSVFGQFYYNLALSEKGQLCNRIFLGNQDFGPMSLSLPTGIENAAKSMHYYYAVGLTGEAHHLAYELMVIHGFRPGNIKMLIKTELIRGNNKIADRYIQVLKKTWHYRTWALKYEKIARNPSQVNSNPELKEKIRFLPVKDFFIGTNDEQNIEILLKDNPQNYKAFEYKIARMLLQKDFVAVAGEVNKMKTAGYSSLPRHIEEALVAYMYFTREVPDLGGMVVRPDTRQRFIQYMEIYNRYNGDKSLLQKNMGQSDKKTFWYYLQFRTIDSRLPQGMPEDNSIYGS